MHIEVYADIACPWCYIGEARLERALAARSDLQVIRHWQPFQLQPQLPPEGVPWATFAARKFGGAGRAATMFEQITELGHAEGLAFDFARMPTAPNTRQAHRLILWAAAGDQEWSTVRALFRAYFAEGRDITELETLVAIAAEVGLDTAEARAYLTGDENSDVVEASQQAAEEVGINGVPAYVLDSQYLLSGAQPPDVWGQVLEQLAAPPLQVGRMDRSQAGA